MENVSLGHLDRVESEHAHRLEEDRGAGNDRRGAIGAEADDLAPLLEPDRSKLAEPAVDRVQQQAIALDLVRVVGVELLVDRGEGGGRAGYGDADFDLLDDRARDSVLN